MATLNFLFEFVVVVIVGILTVIPDVDFSGSAVWNRDTETETDVYDRWDVTTTSRRRTTELPEVLKALVEGRTATDYLFRQTRRRSVGTSGAPRSPRWLQNLVKRVCTEARVKVISPHGLPDAHASILQELSKMEAARIGDRLGHNDGGKTAKKHYIGAHDHRPALSIIVGGKG